MVTTNCNSHILTREQEEAGYYIRETEDFVMLRCKDELVGTYSAMGVTVDQLRQDADTHMHGIRFGVVGDGI